jgi:PKD repeat protein
LNLCQGSSGVIVLSSSQNGLLWNTGSTSPILTVTTGGWYSVAVRSGCCTGRDSVFVNIIPTPVSAFTSSVNDFNVDFSDQSTGVTGTYTYDFGDGNTSSLQNPTHNYAAPGSYTVCLTVTSNGCVDSVCHVVNVTCTMPVINFSYTIGNGGLATFTNSTSPSADNYTWDFGDGSTSNLENPTHVYTASGNYTVCLQISDSCGNDTTCIGISVIANLSTQELFGANFTLSPNPTQNFVLVSAQNLADQIWNLQLVNGIGQEFWGKEISGTTIQETVPMENLASGIYFLRIQSEGRVMDYKLVKE